LTTRASMSIDLPLPKSSVTGTLSPALKSPVTGMPPSVKRLTCPLLGIVIGSNSPAVTPSPVRPESVASSALGSTATVATNVPVPSDGATIRAASTCTSPSR